LAGAERWPIRPAREVSNAEVVVCDVAALDDPDVGTVNALVRLQLTARRAGLSIRLRNASPELQALLALLGLDDVVPLCRATARAEGADRTAGTVWRCRGTR
jgi:ABC-type transporter Mla MlaB component